MSFVPPPPPGVVVPLPPAATPAAPAKVVKPGGVALDMSDLFGPPKSGAKKALPPWERKRKTPPHGAPTSAAEGPLAAASSSPPPPPAPATSVPAPPAVVVPSAPSAAMPATAEAGAAGPNAPISATRKSLPTAELTAIPGAVPPPPLPSAVMLPTDVQASTAAPTSAGAPLLPTLPAVVPLPLTAGVPPPPPSGVPSVPVSGVPPAAVAVPQTAPALPSPAGVAEASATAPAAAPPPPQSQLPVPSTAALAVSARIVEDALRDMRLHLATPSTTVVAPHVVFRGREQLVSVMPLGPLPRRQQQQSAASKKVKTTVPAPSSSGLWHNAFDVRPSPTWRPAHHLGQSQVPHAAAVPSAKKERLGPYFQSVDVHRYTARRYFGEPPPVEH